METEAGPSARTPKWEVRYLAGMGSDMGSWSSPVFQKAESGSLREEISMFMGLFALSVGRGWESRDAAARSAATKMDVAGRSPASPLRCLPIVS